MSIPDIRLKCYPWFLNGLFLSFLFLCLSAIFADDAISSAPDAKQTIRCLVFLDDNPAREERIRMIFKQVNRYLEREGVEAVLL